MMTFKVPLPIDPLFCPRLSCQVFDNVFGGLSQPMIGNFTIPVGDLIKGLREERQREIAAIEKIVEWLTKISKDEMVASYYAHKEKVQAGIVVDDTNDELDSKIA